MTPEIFDEPPDENETFENLDEALDDEDALSGEPGGGHEAAREVGVELVVDEVELEEVGGKLDDPDRISLLDGGIDDPDGAGPFPRSGQDQAEAGWDRDPVEAAKAEDRQELVAGEDVDDLRGADEAGDLDGEDGSVGWDEPKDPQLEVLSVDATELDQIPDDAPGPDAARW